MMSSVSTRDARRRRRLQEEVHETAPSRENSVDDQRSTPPAEGRRYALADDTLGSAVARCCYPQHWLVPITTTVAAAGLLAALIAGHLYCAKLEAKVEIPLQPLLAFGKAESLSHWVASSALLATASGCLTIFLVRKQRVDDYHGHYRWWRVAAVGALLVSLDSVTGLHAYISHLLAKATGWSLLPGAAEWWLTVVALLGGWTGFRLLGDLRESRLAFIHGLAAIAAYLTALVGHFNGLPLASDVATLTTQASLLAGHLLLVTSLVAYARFLRYDVEAGIATRPRASQTTATASSIADTVTSSPTDTLASSTTDVSTDTPQLNNNGWRSSTSRKQRSNQPTATPAVQMSEPPQEQQGEELPAKGSRASRRSPPRPSVKLAENSSPSPSQRGTEWTDGSTPLDERYDDEESPTRKLSKAERKQLRKLKAQRRAA